MSAGLAAAVAAHHRDERDLADSRAAAGRDLGRTLLTVVLVTLWIGAALLVVTTVAPAAFRVLPTRALAGALVGQVLPVVFVSGLVIGLVSFALAARGAAKATLRRIGAAGVVAGCGVAQLLIAPRIEALRARIGPNLDVLAVTDPLRVEFGRLHGLSVLSLGVGMLFALLTLVAATIALRSASRPH